MKLEKMLSKAPLPIKMIAVGLATVSKAFCYVYL